MKTLLSLVSIGSLLAASAVAQMAISAKSGLISYIEGRVLLGQEQVVVKMGGRLTEMKPDQTLQTEEGRAEILLTPGVILRLGENSAVKMIANRLEDTRVELTAGSAVVEATEIDKAHAVTLLVGQAAVGLRKMALLSLNAQSGVKMFKGEAQVIAGGEAQILREGRQITAAAPFVATRFDKNATDPLYRWASRRGEIVAMANIASARTLETGFRSGSGLGSGFLQGGWIYNPFFGICTYLPASGMLRSPFGFFYYSPGLVNRYYNQVLQAALPVPAPAIGGAMGGPRFDNNLGYVVNSRGGMAAGTSAPVSGGGGAPAAAAPAPSRGDAGGGVRGGGGGGSAQ
ncbi:MAG: FecR domain-containing protein [Acidobacteriota bacterium]|jgi:hypothetical protein